MTSYICIYYINVCGGGKMSKITYFCIQIYLRTVFLRLCICVFLYISRAQTGSIHRERSFLK